MKLKILTDNPSVLEAVESKRLDQLDLSLETEHYVFRYVSGSLAEKEIISIADEQENGYSKLKELFGYEMPLRIEFFLTSSPDENGEILNEIFEGMGPYPTNACCIGPNYVFAAYNDEVKAIGCHEDAHLFSYMLCMPKSQLLSEGLAVFSDGAFWGRPNPEWVSEFLKNGSYISVRELASDENFWNTAPEISYPISGAFVGFLIDRLGKESFLCKVYASDKPLFENLCELFGMNEDEIEKSFVNGFCAT